MTLDATVLRDVDVIHSDLDRGAGCGASIRLDEDIVQAPVYSAWSCGKCKVSESCTLPECAQVQTSKVCRPAESHSSKNDGEMAMAARPSMPSALDLSKEWLCDTGAAFDLVSRDKADFHTNFQAPAKPINFQTDNGAYRADKTLSMTTPALGKEESKAYITENTPSALSIGQRIMHK